MDEYKAENSVLFAAPVKGGMKRGREPSDADEVLPLVSRYPSRISGPSVDTKTMSAQLNERANRLTVVGSSRWATESAKRNGG